MDLTAGDPGKTIKYNCQLFLFSCVSQARLVQHMCTGAGRIVGVPAALISILEWPLLTQLETHSVFLNLVEVTLEMTCVDLLP